MADQLQLRGGTTAEHSTFTGALREVTVDTDKDTVVVHDGSTAGGHPLAKQNLSNVPAGTITSTMIADGTIVNADVNASAAIAGTKISPDFGSQNVTTTGTSTAASFIPSSSTAPTNGVYLPSANNVAISTNGTGRLFVDSSGNVGVGTATPSNLIHVAGAYGAGTVRFEDTANTNSIGKVFGYAGGLYLQSRNNTNYGEIVFRGENSGGTTEYMRLDSSGRLGLGTSSPGARLSVQGGQGGISNPSNGTIDVIDETTAAQGVGGQIVFRGQFQSGGYTQYGAITAYKESATVDGSQYGAALVFNTRTQGGNNTEKLRITSDGKVGVGTTSPGVKTHIVSAAVTHSWSHDASDTLAIENNGAAGLNIISADNNVGNILFSDGTSRATGFIQYSHNSQYLRFAVEDNERLRIDSSGRVGIGTSSPSYKLDVSVATNDPTTGSPAAGSFLQVAGGTTTVGNGPSISLSNTSGAKETFWRMSAVTVSGNNGDLVFNGYNGGANYPERLRITAAGNVGIGATPSAKLHVNTGTNENLWVGSLGGSGAGVYLASVNDSGSANTPMQIGSASVINFAINGTEAARIDSSRRLLVGTSTASAATGWGTPAVQFAGDYQQSALLLRNTENNANVGALILQKIRASSIVQSGDALGFISFNGYDGSTDRAGAYIQANVDGTPGAGDMPTRLVFSTTADGASSPTERMRIDRNGAVGIGKTPDLDPTTNGFEVNSGAVIATRAGAGILFINRNTDDGSLVSFRQAATEEGTISVSGTTVSYNGAHLSRWSQILGIDPHDKDARPEILRGTVMSNLDEMCDWIDPESGDAQDNEQLNKTKISDVEGDKNVAGVFQSWDDDDDTWVNDYYLAMTGDFVIRVAAGTTVERGDLLMSAGDGTAKPQDDDIIRSKTIAKVTSTTVSCTYDDGSYCVPCVLMAC